MGECVTENSSVYGGGCRWRPLESHPKVGIEKQLLDSGRYFPYAFLSIR